jgi:hypothetical protein
MGGFRAQSVGGGGAGELNHPARAAQMHKELNQPAWALTPLQNLLEMERKL